MFGRKEKNQVSAPKHPQTKAEFDLKKLKRIDLLELLYEQVRENEANAVSVAELTELNDSLKAKLDKKDAQIASMIKRLDEKDAQIAELKKSRDLYARAVGMVDASDLARFQETALQEYLEMIARHRQ